MPENQAPNVPEINVVLNPDSQDFTATVWLLYKELNENLKQISAIASDDIVVSVHLARKRLKSYRAFLKLLRTPETANLYKKSNIVLRDQGRLLSGIRDIHVRRGMIAPAAQEGQPVLLDAETRKMLMKYANREFSEMNRNMPRISETVHAIYECCSSSSVIENYISNTAQHVTAEHLSEDFLISSEKAKHAFLQISSPPGSADHRFHEWRKRMKDVQNQLKFLFDAGTLANSGLYIQISEICDNLGLLNDLCMTLDWVSKIYPATELNRSELDKIHKKTLDEISFRKKNLLAEGNRLYSTWNLKNPERVIPKQ